VVVDGCEVTLVQALDDMLLAQHLAAASGTNMQENVGANSAGNTQLSKCPLPQTARLECRQVVHREDTWQCKPTARTV
jgi:hypothetical protein